MFFLSNTSADNIPTNTEYHPQLFWLNYKFEDVNKQTRKFLAFSHNFANENFKRTAIWLTLVELTPNERYEMHENRMNFLPYIFYNSLELFNSWYSVGKIVPMLKPQKILYGFFLHLLKW